MDISTAIRETIEEHGGLTVDVASLKEDSDLYQAGLGSHATISLMLALEDRFVVEFSDFMLTKESFRSIAAIRDRIIELGGSDPA